MSKQFSKDGTRLKHKEYREWLRTQPCAVTGYDYVTDCCGCFGDIVPAHGKPLGRGIKGPDYEAIAMCFKHHNLEHLGKLTIKDEARQKLVDALNERYCKLNNLTLKELRGKC
ncbi:MAG: hypothetical protein WC886_08030 [Saccharofermentanaceae bacterium]